MGQIPIWVRSVSFKIAHPPPQGLTLFSGHRSVFFGTSQKNELTKSGPPLREQFEGHVLTDPGGGSGASSLLRKLENAPSPGWSESQHSKCQEGSQAISPPPQVTNRLQFNG